MTQSQSKGNPAIPKTGSALEEGRDAEAPGAGAGRGCRRGTQARYQSEGRCAVPEVDSASGSEEPVPRGDTAPVKPRGAGTRVCLRDEQACTD